jgi:hypothetical protein
LEMLELRREARNNGTTQLEQEEVDREAEWIRASEYHAARLRDETRQNRQERLDREDRRQDDIIREGGRRNWDGGQRWWDGGHSAYCRRWQGGREL